MSLTLVKRSTNGAPITAVQNDANMTAIETAVNANTTNIASNTTAVAACVTNSALNAMFDGVVGGKQTIDYSNVNNVPDPIDVNTYPAAGYSGSSQTVSLVGASVSPVKITTITSVYINPDGQYSGTNSKYTAPSHGYYLVSASLQIDNSTAVAASMEGYIKVGINGATTLNGIPVGGFSVASPPGSRWYPQVHGLIELNANDYAELFVSAHDGTNTGDITVSNVIFNILKVK